MLGLIALIKQSIYKKKQQGFVVLSAVMLLCIAGIMFTANMISSQLLDNQVIANYYRNKEAFLSAESGIHFALSQLPPPTLSEPLPTGLPFVYVSADNHYSATVTESAAQRLQITSEGTSADGSAKKVMTLEVEPYFDFPIPTAALSSNGKVNLRGYVQIINGCDASGECQKSGNVAENSLLTNPGLDSVDWWCSELLSIGKNIIEDDTLLGNISISTVDKITDSDGTERYDWGDSLFPEGTEIGGIKIDSELSASSLFEKTFGTQMNQGSLDTLRNNALFIDVYAGDHCLDKLQEVTDADVIIFITGICNLNSSSESIVIGSIEHPKLVIIEGGSFNTPVDIFGMVYFVPGSNTSGSLIDSKVDMGRVSVEGALLSEYRCSYPGKDSLSVNFNKSLLNDLYAALGVGISASGYRLSVGTWRDFE